ncbi:chain length-determining protein (plasmid) [Ruegeria sp. SCSIO 43209]|uniref:GumC family protein n=1 Tax=Ruegeria sp. SCSIO 43209 TaxID=2793010 RepID=UPI00147DF327|nr:chain length-determining protein [Ruegeria sp. SCSIO 43209]UAB91743.1 chain length-determining protein [Ruegeria sp. SCSIO 43209]
MNLPFRFYWSLFKRRLPVMMALFLICSGLGVVTALQLPPTYMSSARLQVDPPQIPDEMVVSTIRTEVAEQLQLIEEQLMTRANLIDIAQRHQVFEGMAAMTPDRIVQAMRDSTRILRSGGRGQASLMAIQFDARDAQIAADVVNDYVTLVLEANSSFRRERTENTLSFFEQEAARLAGEIEEESSRIIAFKNENVDALPEDLSYRQDRQSTLQERLGRLEQDRASIVSQRSEMIAVFEATGRLGSDTRRELSPEEQRLQQLELQLAEDLTVYSDSNPRVVQLRRQIEQLELAISGGDPGDWQEGTEAEPTFLDITLAEMDSRIEEIDLEIVRVNEELERLSRAIAATATNSITLERLEQDLESARTRYNSVLGNLNQARMAERIEINAQGERISLIEGASVPQEPSGPARKKIAVMGGAVGGALALAYFMLLELLNQRVRHPAELQSRFEIVPIGVIPYLESRGEKWRRRLLRLSALAIVIVAVPAALYYVHTEYVPLEILVNRVLVQMGLA